MQTYGHSLHVKKMNDSYTVVTFLFCHLLIHHLWSHLFFSMQRDVPLFCRVELFSSLLWCMSVTVRDSHTCVYRFARAYTHEHRRDSPLWSLGALLPLFITVVCVSRGGWWWWWIIDLPDHVLFRSITFLADIIIYSIITRDHVVCIQFCVFFFSFCIMFWGKEWCLCVKWAPSHVPFLYCCAVWPKICIMVFF